MVTRDNSGGFNGDFILAGSKPPTVTIVFSNGIEVELDAKAFDEMSSEEYAYWADSIENSNPEDIE